LNGLVLSIKPGEVIGIQGLTGRGNPALIELLALLDGRLSHA